MIARWVGIVGGAGLAMWWKRWCEMGGMKRVKLAGFGGPEVLVVEEVPVPKPNAGEVLVRVAAAGVNRPDVLQRKGKYPLPPGADPTPGLEVAGVIAELGAGVEQFAKDHPCVP